ncbi:ABC transporter related protein [Coriobacterium glomerans PW2]|uniref:ABC transporter related protein n=1 Tax=Coriobacterium glomerans (strain ATCC 49209 / DSM 20642 / JCM 10262 / PW2) TaxID=700015 RepID=F2N813_CORGP|nr:ABC transporter ATP-binding protein [Coriobacterium glomerans]AEB07196.1 ABC transporter related protein [Coriobacterium glomerans PW2]
MRPAIELRAIHRIFETEAGFAHVLHNISLTVDTGEFIAITGPSGSGKSTLMNILGCLDTPTSGTYLLEGLDVAKLNDDELAEVRGGRIGFVFQSFNLLPRMSVIDNVMLPLSYTDCRRADRERRAIHALRAVELPVDHCDHRTNQLSGGQMQRVAIARALVRDPAIILADEPTGNLDSSTGAAVLATFHRLRAQGKTIVLITHDERIAAVADRTIEIRDGRLRASATRPPLESPTESDDAPRAAEAGVGGMNSDCDLANLVPRVYPTLQGARP